ncbi:hypothetical protein Scep_009073 [Stephania cephalantha]|uniref:Pentatricopeptide repeat-containing protein n=1 Tax=Stephania cephalantha TaxID=152367 RepID=A0AAP0JSL4_9MAGN
MGLDKLALSEFKIDSGPDNEFSSFMARVVQTQNYATIDLFNKSSPAFDPKFLPLLHRSPPPPAPPNSDSPLARSLKSMSKLIREKINYFSKPFHHEQLQRKIESLCKLRRVKDALHILNSEPISSQPSPSLYSPILQLCIDLKAEKEGRLIHYDLMKNGHLLDLNISTKLIIFYAKIGDMGCARNVFDEMYKRNVVSWTAMVSGYSRNGCSREALEVFSLMRRSGFRANQFTYGSVLRACTSLMCLKGGEQCQSVSGEIDKTSLAKMQVGGGMVPDQFTFGSMLKVCGGGRFLLTVSQIHGQIIQLGFGSYNVLNGSLIDAYVKCRCLRNAKLLYNVMEGKDLVSCTALITGYAQEGNNYWDAFNLFSELNQMDVGIDGVILCSMLNLCANSASLSLGRQIHALALKRLPNFDVAMGNALIDMYAKVGEIENANLAFDEMQKKNVISWTSLITGYGKHGYGEKALSLFEKMEGGGFQPNDVTFLSILFACSHTGMVDKGWECFNRMITEHNISPRSEHYSCMIDLLARNGQLEQAFDLVNKMKAKVTASVWGALFGACRTFGSNSFLKFTARRILDLDPMNSVNYVVLANIYSAADLWEEARKTRELMEDRGLKKEPAYKRKPTELDHVSYCFKMNYLLCFYQMSQTKEDLFQRRLWEKPNMMDNYAMEARAEVSLEYPAVPERHAYTVPPMLQSGTARGGEGRAAAASAATST